MRFANQNILFTTIYMFNLHMACPANHRTVTLILKLWALWTFFLLQLKAWLLDLPIRRFILYICFSPQCCFSELHLLLRLKIRSRRGPGLEPSSQFWLQSLVFLDRQLTYITAGLSVKSVYTQLLCLIFHSEWFGPCFGGRKCPADVRLNQ